MRKILFLLPVLAVFVAVISASPAQAQSEPGYYSISDLPPDNLLSPEELDDLLAPIALYPDPLLAQILPAATFVDQIDEAARYVRQFGQYARVDDQPWDISVRAVAHYPDVLYMMDRKYDWTVALGQAYIDQPQDVMESIQVLRAEARDRGNLYSTAQQQVVVEPDGDIRIVPAAPQYIYVPVYDPQVIYVEQRPSYGFITFGAGFAIGAWLSRDVDWREHRVYYHGWKGRGWVERSRPHIHDRRGVYINRNASNIVINRRVLQRDTGRFRQELRHDVEQRKTLPGRPVGRPGRGEQHPRTDQQRPRGDQGRPPAAERGPRPGQEQRPPVPGRQPGATAPHVGHPAAGQPPAATSPRPAAAPQQRPGAAPAAPAAAAAPPAPAPAATRPATTDVFRGRDVKRDQPASRSGYGGYGTSKDATIYRERGQSSRERMREGGRPAASQPSPPAAVKPAPAPAVRQPAAPAAAPRATAPQAAPAAPAARPAPRPHVPRPVTPGAAPAAPAAPRTPPAEGGHERR